MSMWKEANRKALDNVYKSPKFNDGYLNNARPAGRGQLQGAYRDIKLNAVAPKPPTPAEPGMVDKVKGWFSDEKKPMDLDRLYRHYRDIKLGHGVPPTPAEPGIVDKVKGWFN